jgi:hypothetical protein
MVLKIVDMTCCERGFASSYRPKKKTTVDRSEDLRIYRTKRETAVRSRPLIMYHLTIMHK